LIANKREIFSHIILPEFVKMASVSETKKNECNIKGLNKAKLLSALYNASKPLGMGFMNPASKTEMTEEQAENELKKNSSMYFDYLNGRVMKISLKDDTLDTWGYNRDNGAGSAEKVVDALKNKKKLPVTSKKEMINEKTTPISGQGKCMLCQYCDATMLWTAGTGFSKKSCKSCHQNFSKNKAFRSAVMKIED